ncbi:MAG: tyrosine-type recombinase/integrase [Planctomycetes bacterium]|nr:tyrosine-type recombinase/integrase [Planctomycetota bacterium]
MQPCNLDMSGKLWLYRPSSHKTEHYGHERVIELGPKTQGIIKEFLKPDLGAFLFSPADATEERNAERRRNRKTPITPSQARRKRKACPKKQPGDHYTTASYGRCIALACEKAGVPRWTSHQLRHSYATRIRKEHGIESARILLGHRSMAVTEVYSEIDRTKVARVVARVG